MKIEPPIRGFLISVFVFAVVLRFAVGVATKSWVIPSDANHWDFGYEMGRIAGSLAAGDGFAYPTDPPQPTAWMAPAYPIFVASIFRIFGAFTPKSAVAIEVIQALASALSCVLLYSLAANLYGPKVGQISAFLFAIYPASIHFSVQKFWSTTLFSTVMIGALLLYVIQTKKPTTSGLILLGFIYGVCVLFNPVFMATIVPLSVWSLWKWKREDKGGLKATLLLAGIFILVISPWLARNYVVFGRFVFIKSNLGHEVLIGNHDSSSGILPSEMSGIERQVLGLKDPIPGLSFTEMEMESLTQLNELEKNSFYLYLGREFILRDPIRFIRLTCTRVFRYWTLIRVPRTPGEIVSYCAYFFVLLGAMVGAAIALRDRSELSPIVVPILFFPAAYYVTIVGLYRYRFPIEPLLIILASVAIATVRYKGANHQQS